MKISELITTLQQIKFNTTFRDVDVWINDADGQPCELDSVESADFGYAASLTPGEKVEFYVVPSIDTTRRQR